MLGSVYELSWSLSRTEIYVIDIGYGPVLDMTELVECDLDWSWVRGYPESIFLILEPDLYWDEIDIVGIWDLIRWYIDDVGYQE